MCCFETLQIVSSTVGYVYSAVLDVGIGRAVLCCYVHVPHWVVGMSWHSNRHFGRIVVLMNGAVQLPMVPLTCFVSFAVQYGRVGESWVWYLLNEIVASSLGLFLLLIFSHVYGVTWSQGYGMYSTAHVERLLQYIHKFMDGFQTVPKVAARAWLQKSKHVLEGLLISPK